MLEIKINSIGDFFNALVTITRVFGNTKPWWRGHANIDWKLTSSIYHQHKKKSESNMSNRFVNYGRVRYKDFPAYNDKASWLFLMQHYGIPTRLMDWSLAPLTSLFFVINNHNYIEQDGIIWALCATKLNKTQLNKETVVSINNPESTKLINHIFEKNPKYESNKCLALNSQHIDIRQMVQSSEFTLHGTETPLDEMDGCESYLAKIIIPKSFKPGIKQYIDLLNITQSNLFPDLEHLANELVGHEYIIANK